MLTGAMRMCMLLSTAMVLPSVMHVVVPVWAVV